jgi:hypothetical protein
LYLIKAGKNDNKLISYRLRFIEITVKLYVIAVCALRDKIITATGAPVIRRALISFGPAHHLWAGYFEMGALSFTGEN